MAESFRRQTWALVKKNITIILVRSWFWTAFRALILPIVFVTLLLEIQNFSKQRVSYGVSNPKPAQSLAESMGGSSRKLAIVQSAGLADDVQEALKRLTEPLDQGKVMYIDDEDQIWDKCEVDFQGNSNCHAVITFNDSPGSALYDTAWNYTIRVDPAKQSREYSNIMDHNNVVEGFWLPLQVAIDNAVTNTSANPESFSFQSGTQEEYDREKRIEFLGIALYILSFVFFASMSTVVHHVSSMMGGERDSGISQLIDAMGGGVAWPRVISYVITFDILYLPLWIILGCRKWSPEPL